MSGCGKSDFTRPGVSHASISKNREASDVSDLGTPDSRTLPSPNTLEDRREVVTSALSDTAYYPPSKREGHGTRLPVSLRSTTSGHTLVDAGFTKTILFRLLQEAGVLDGEHDRDLYERFSELFTLWKEWKTRGCIGFMKKDLKEFAQDEYDLLVRTLEESRGWPLDQEEDAPDFMAFLRSMHLDYYPKLKKCVAVAPVFSEDLSFTILGCMLSGLLRCSYGFCVAPPSMAPKSVIKSDRVECSLTCSSIILDTSVRGSKDVFICRVTQSREEFLYEIQKVAQALESLKQLQGFMVVLIAPLNAKHRRAFSRVELKTGVELTKELGILFYHREDFPRFKATVGRGSGFKVWERDDYLMRLLDASYPFSTVPGGRYPVFSNFIQRVITSYHILLAETSANRQPRGLFNGADASSFDVNADVVDVSSLSAGQAQLIMAAQVAMPPMSPAQVDMVSKILAQEVTVGVLGAAVQATRSQNPVAWYGAEGHLAFLQQGLLGQVLHQ